MAVNVVLITPFMAKLPLRIFISQRSCHHIFLFYAFQTTWASQFFFSQKTDLILEDMIHPQNTNDYSFEDDNDLNQSLPDSVTETTTGHFKLHKYRI